MKVSAPVIVGVTIKVIIVHRKSISLILDRNFEFSRKLEESTVQEELFRFSRDTPFTPEFSHSTYYP